MEWHVDEFFGFRDRVWISGWAYDAAGIKAIEYRNGKATYRLVYGDSSPDLEKQHGKGARNCRFHGDIPSRWTPEGRIYAAIGGEFHELRDPCVRKMENDAYHRLNGEFYRSVRGNVLEIGSRARSGVVRRSWFDASVSYTGLDIKPGDNVDIVGDAHELSRLFPANSFDAVFACSVFEHLLMPWKVVLEINRVLKRGGLVMATSHQTWPLHDTPWDYWRFSDRAWRALFNPYAGFQVVKTGLGEPGYIVAAFTQPVTNGLERQPAALGSAVLAEKTAETELRWDVPASELADSVYPA